MKCSNRSGSGSRRVSLRRGLFIIVLAAGMGLTQTQANERYFTYTYEPETLPKGAAEFEQWVTLRAGRDATVGQDNYTKWELREELEYGVTDRYSVSLYLNYSSESFRDPATGETMSDSSFDGVSIENRYMVLNPADHAVGMTLYFEPRYSGDEAELEEKIIFGQRFGEWKWALNLTHATEWSESLREVEGEVEVSFGINRRLNRNWFLGIEARDHNEIPSYTEWENTAIYVGPVVTFQKERWWATLTLMPQVAGVNFTGNVDGNHALELEGHERLNVRMIIGISF